MAADATPLHVRRERAQAELARQAHAAMRAFSHNILLLQDRIQHANGQLAGLEARLDEIQPLLPHPDARFLLGQTALEIRVYESFRLLLEADLDVNAYNLELAEHPERLVRQRFRQTPLSVAYQEAKARLDLALAWYYWSVRIEGIDLAMRAMMNEHVIPPPSPEEAARRTASARELRARLMPDRDAAMLLASLAGGFAETRDLLQWGLDTLPELDVESLEKRRAVLQRPEWAKLNGKLQFLTALWEKAARHPQLAAIFPAPEAPPTLPFTTAAEAARLGLDGQTPGPARPVPPARPLPRGPQTMPLLKRPTLPPAPRPRT